MNKLYIETHGCQMNEYDSSKMVDVLMAVHALEKTDDPALADIVLLNTCSIRERAQEKVFSQLGRFRELKQQKPELIIGVGGCVASQEGDALLKRAPYVDLVFGPQTIHRLNDMLDQRKRTQKPVVDISFPEIEKFDRLPEAKADGVSAFVTIMEGCSKYCSFCVVPYTRGIEISRPLDDVIAEVAGLVNQGVKEITLLGQNVNDYRGPTHEGGVADLAALIEYIAVLDGLERIRFTTSHPVAFSNRLIQAYRDVPKLADHLHLPVQSGSDRILAAMKRGYTSLEYKAKVRKLRQVRPNLSLSTDIIVGFPGESDSDFEATLNLVHEMNFDHSYCFIYSPRPGTPASQLPDDVPMSVKKARLQRLQQRLTLQVSTITARMVGSTQRVMVSGVCKDKVGHWKGRTENNRVVSFAAEKMHIGQIVSVEVTDATTYSLKGTLLRL